MKKIRIIVADDHAVLQAGLESMLNAQPDMIVIGAANDGFACIRQAVALRPDIILLDINMPNCNGLEALDALRTQTPETKILVLTMHDDPLYLRQVMKAGAAGFVLKQAAGDELLAAIRAVYQGGVYLHPAHAKLLLTPDAQPQANQPTPPRNAAQERFALLSERETQIFRLVALGYRNQEIADQLILSVKTVETYKSRMMDKLGITNRIALMQFAIELGVLDAKTA
jgi:two-component system, NarL family, response regulator NreC